MKNVLPGFLFIFGSLFLSYNASAQLHMNSSATVSVTIVTELSLSKLIDLKLEDQNIDSLNNLQSKKTYQTGRIIRKKSTNLQSRSEIIPASFSLTGAGTYVYAVTIPTVATAVNKKGEPIKVETYLTSKYTNTSSLRPDSTFNMSGKLIIASNQRRGTYVLVGGLDLAVNFN